MKRARLGYRPALDGIRGLAILGVLFRHAFHVPPGGGFGVDLFFVLSGFLITTLLLEERDATGTISFRAFYRRRALRLFPALAVMLVAFVVAVTARALVEGKPTLLTDGLRAVAVAGFYTGNFAAAFHRDLLGHFSIGQLWSLAEEEQFYLLWPLALAVALRRGVSRRAIVGTLWLLILAVVTERFVLTYTGGRPDRIYYGPDTHADGLLAGCLLALLLRRPARLAADRSLGYMCLLAFGFVAYNPRFGYTGVAPIAIPASVGLVATVVAQPAGLVTRALSLRPLVGIGRISYGLYLWHGLALWTLGPDHRWLGIATGLACAVLSYRYVEQPFLRRKRGVGAGMTLSRGRRERRSGAARLSWSALRSGS